MVLETPPDHSLTGSHNFTVSTDGVGPIDRGDEAGVKVLRFRHMKELTQAGSLD